MSLISPSARYLLDTNVLLRRADASSLTHQRATDAVTSLLANGAAVYLTPQNIIEFWNVATRPQSKNGLGWDTAKAEAELSALQKHFLLLPDSPAIFTEWERLVSAYNVQGVQVHDTRLAAVALVYRVENILTFNVKDFRRFAPEGLSAVDPTTMVAPTP